MADATTITSDASRARNQPYFTEIALERRAGAVDHAVVEDQAEGGDRGHHRHLAARPRELGVGGDDVGEDERRHRGGQQQPAQDRVHLPAATGRRGRRRSGRSGCRDRSRTRAGTRSGPAARRPAIPMTSLRCSRPPNAPRPYTERASASSASSSHGPCAVSRRCRPSRCQRSSVTGRSDGCASGSARRAHGDPVLAARVAGAGQLALRRRLEPGVEREAPGRLARVSSRFQATSTPRSATCTTSTQRASGSGAAGAETGGRGARRPRRSPRAARACRGR